jgi:hypothetical protein
MIAALARFPTALRDPESQTSIPLPTPQSFVSRAGICRRTSNNVFLLTGEHSAAMDQASSLAAIGNDGMKSAS